MTSQEAPEREGLAQVFGAGTTIRWERPLLLALAWFLTSVTFSFVQVREFGLVPEPPTMLGLLATSLLLRIMLAEAGRHLHDRDRRHHGLPLLRRLAAGLSPGSRGPQDRSHLRTERVEATGSRIEFGQSAE